MFQKGECDEYDASSRLVPFKGLMEGDLDGSEEEEEDGSGTSSVSDSDSDDDDESE